MLIKETNIDERLDLLENIENMKQLKNAGIYVLRCRPTEKCYAGKDHNLGARVKTHLTLKSPECPAIHAAIKKHGADAFDVELIPYPGVSPEDLCELEIQKIAALDSFHNGYNCTEGGEGGNPEIVRKTNRKRVEAGTHNFLGGELQRETNRKRVENGTHQFLGDSNPSCQRVEAGTHHFLGGELQHETNHKRIEDGTHNFLGENNPSHRRVADGTHNFLGESNPNHKRVADGTHHLLGENNPSHKRVADGTHHLLGENNPSHKRVADGTHHFLDRSFYIRREWKKRKKRKRWRRKFYRVMAVLLYTQHLTEAWLYEKRKHEGFFRKDILDTSKSEQLQLF